MTRIATVGAFVTLAVAAAGFARAYPLDAAEATGIHRLEAYRLAAPQLVKAGRLAPGATFPGEKIRLRLVDHPSFEIPAPDPEFTRAISALLGPDQAAYGVAVLDISDPAKPRYAEHNAGMIQNPGSVGKIMVALGWFQALADVYPDDVDARIHILKTSQIRANQFIRKDSHTVPFYAPGDARVRKRPIEEGDVASLWTYLDWMCSASSNGAAGMLASHLVLISHFGKAYPVSDEVAAKFFADTPKAKLQQIFLNAITGPVSRNGLDLSKLRQGSFFTRQGKTLVPGTSSHATARELLRYVVRMEQGRLVDAWSSLEIKRLLYLTDRRVRYASAPALRHAALVFKSGSLYGCKPEPGFSCGKYMGNRMNYMNSMTAVETFDTGFDLHYISVVLSNVLRKNSAVEHQMLGTRVHRLIESFHPGSAAGDDADWTEEDLLRAAEGRDE